MSVSFRPPSVLSVLRRPAFLALLAAGLLAAVWDHTEPDNRAGAPHEQPLPSLPVEASSPSPTSDARSAAGHTSPAPEAPRILSLVPAATETLFALGLGEHVVGRSRFCEYPEAARSLPAVGDFFTLNERDAAALRPTHAYLYRTNVAAQARLLDALGATVLSGATEDAASVVAFADRIGETFPALTNGLACGPWRTRMLALADAPAPAPGAPSALVAVSHADTPWTDACAAGGDSFYDELLRATGYSNVLASASGYLNLTPERVLELAPDFVFDLRPADGPMGAAPSPDPNAAESAYWAFLPASTRLVVLRDPAALIPGPRMPDVADLFRAANAPAR